MNSGPKALGLNLTPNLKWNSYMQSIAKDSRKIFDSLYHSSKKLALSKFASVRFGHIVLLLLYLFWSYTFILCVMNCFQTYNPFLSDESF